MKLLFDQNLSPRLSKRLSDIYPESMHVCEVGLDKALDIKVWEYARENAYIIVSKDSDFGEMNMVHGFPPKVIWIRRGNCSTKQVEILLRDDYPRIEELYENENIGVLLVY